MGEADRVDAMYRAYRTIMAAARRGTISPQAALRWARRAASGEPVQVLASLSEPAPEDRRAWQGQAATSDLAQRVLDILIQLVDQSSGADQAGPRVSEDFQGLWPPGTFEIDSPTGLGHYAVPTAPLVYGPPDEEGNRVAPRRRPPMSTPTFPAYVAYASAGPPADRGEIGDEEADALFPPRARAETDRRRVAAAAPLVEDLPDEDLYRLLFGDLPGEDAG